MRPQVLAAFFISAITVGVLTAQAETLGVASRGPGLGCYQASCKVDLGSGTNDYLTSDSVGLNTPAYLYSQYPLTSGAGIISTAVLASGGTGDNFTSAVGTAASQGTISYNTTDNRMWEKGVRGYHQLGQPHTVTERQSLSTRIFGVGDANQTFPQVAERIPCQAATFGGTIKTYDMYWQFLDNSPLISSTAGNGYTYQRLTISGADNALGYLGCTGITGGGGAAVLETPFSPATDGIMWCQQVRAISVNTPENVSFIAGMLSYVPPDQAVSLTGKGMAFIYAEVPGSGVPSATNWNACAHDGTTQQCVDTGITVTAGGDYELCAYWDKLNSSTEYYYINGAFVGGTRRDLNANATNLGPMVYFDDTDGTGTANYFGVGVMQVESR